MKIGGIIAEYNPFHNGHKYQIKEFKERYNITHLVVAMSGNFIQRGGPAIIDKFTRANMAVENGVDLVIEIPAYMATQTAEIYARGGILALNSLKCVDLLCFGSEEGNIKKIHEAASVAIGKKGDFEESICNYLNAGDSFPVAREKAILDNLRKKNENVDNKESLEKSDEEEFLRKPNNILGIEYIKELIRLDSNIKPVTIKRLGSEHKNEFLDAKISSATSIRKVIESNLYNGDLGICNIQNHMPYSSYKLLGKYINEGYNPIFDESFYSEICMEVIRSEENLEEYFEVKDGLEKSIRAKISTSDSLEDAVNHISTKAYTKAKVRRCLFNILLGIRKSDIESIKEIYSLPYIRVLGFNDRGKEILKKVKKDMSEVIIGPAKAKKGTEYNKNILYKLMLDFDLRSSNIYYQKACMNNRKLLNEGEIDYIIMHRLFK